METIIEHLTEMESLLDTLEQGVESTCAERRQLTGVQAALTEQNKALEEKNTALVSENKLLKTENEILRQQIASLEQQVASLEQRISSLGEVVSESQTKLLAMEQCLQALKADKSESPLVPVATNIHDSNGSMETTDPPKRKKRKKVKATDANQPQLPFDFFD